MKKFFILVMFILNILLNNFSVFASNSKPREINLISPSAVVIDAKTGVVIFDKNKDEKHYPASITKVMTALLTIEYAKSIDAKDGFLEKIVFSKEAVNSAKNSSNISMFEGETLTIRDALYAMMLESANEVANALAEKISGNNSNFANLMNKRAKELGATNTNFANPHGLNDPNHYTTAQDMALIFKEAIKHREFLDLIGTLSYDIDPTEKQTEIRKLNNSNKMILPSSKFYNEDVYGGKTGYTTDAKHTLATYAKRGENELIIIILNADKYAPYKDTTALIKYCFPLFKEHLAFNSLTYDKKVNVFNKDNSLVGTVNVKASSDVSVTIAENKIGNINIKEILPEKLNRSVAKDEEIGQIMVYCDDVLIGTSKAVASNAVLVEKKVEQASVDTKTEKIDKTDKSFFKKITLFAKTPSINISPFVFNGLLIFLGVIFGIIIKLRFDAIRLRNRRSARYRLRKVQKPRYKYKKL